MAAPGYVLSVVFPATSTVCAMWPPRRAGWTGTAAYLLGFVASELPLLMVYLLLLDTALAWVQGDLRSRSGVLGLVVTGLTVVGLAALVARAFATAGALDRALTRGWSGARAERQNLLAHLELSHGRHWGRLLLVPFLRRRRDVERVADLVYGPNGRFNRLDLYRHRSHPTECPVFVHLHGGRFFSGGKNRESLPLLYHLAANGWIVISANYRLSRRAPFPAPHVDAKRVLAWTRQHIRHHGGDPDTVVIAGNSAGAHLAVFAALTPNDLSYQPGFPHADTSVTAAVGLGGYYGPLDARTETSLAAHVHADGPPILLLHGGRDSVVPVGWAREFVATLRAAHQSVLYAELPGAQHTFDYFNSFRTAPIIDVVEAFTRQVRHPSE